MLDVRKEGSADVSNSRSTEAHEDGEEREASSDRVEYQSVGQAMCDCSANVSDISAEGLQSLICAVSKGRSAALSKSIDARDGVAPLAQSKLGSAHTGGQEPDGVPDGVAHADHNKKYEGAESEEDAAFGGVDVSSGGLTGNPPESLASSPWT
jgi:hypothetical protein